jgi:putative hydrolase of the HAD superfamily
MNQVKNLVFDIGRVLVTWNPENIYKTLFRREDFKKHPLSTMPGSPTWLELDRGTIELEDAINIMAKGHKDYHGEIDRFFREAPHHITPIWDSVNCAMKYKELGFRIYLLSNFPKYGFKIIQSKFNFFDKFHGKVISCDVKTIKPEKAIYEKLLNTYSIEPNETIFIDDMEVNIKSAEDIGIKGLHFTKGMDLCMELTKIL